MPRPTRFSPEVRARAVRMVVEHEAAHDSQWAAISSIAEKIGCSAETLRKWVRQAERDADHRPGLTSEERSASSSSSVKTSSCAAPRDSSTALGVFRQGGARPPTQVMVA
jgi:transposase-like protein